MTSLVHFYKYSKYHSNSVLRRRKSSTGEAWIICTLPAPLWVLAAVLESDYVATGAAALGVLLSGLWLIRLLENPRTMLSLLKLGGVSLLFMMSFGWLMAVYFNVFALGRSVSVAINNDVGTSVSAYCGAVAYTLTFAAILASLGNLKAIKRLEALAMRKFLSNKEIPARKISELLLAICVLEIILIFTGVINYRNFGVGEYGANEQAWFIPLLGIIFVSQTGLNSLAIYKIADRQPQSRHFVNYIIVASSVLLILFVNFTKGRSGFIFCALLHIYYLALFLGQLPRLSKMLPVIFLVLPILYTGSLLNTFMRSSEAGLKNIEGVGIISLLSQAIDTWDSDKSLRELEKFRSASNLGSRPLLAAPLAKSMALPAEQKTFAFGENLLNSLVWALPRVFFPDKEQYPVMEELLYAHFPFGAEDTADSPYLYAYVDFGYAGLIIYPVFLASTWLLILSILRLAYVKSLTTLVIICSWFILFSLSMGEIAMVGWFVNFRNLVAVIPIVAAIEKLFKIKRRPFAS